MASVNKAIIVGNLGRDPEVRYTQSGRAMARFPVATKETWMDRDNSRQERTDWHNIVVWGKQGRDVRPISVQRPSGLYRRVHPSAQLRR